MNDNEATGNIIGKAMKVHTALGPGLLEAAYEICLMYELRKAGIRVERQKPLPLVYETVKLEHGYRVDLLVEDCIIVEIKSIEAIGDIHIAQVLTYLRLANLKLGLLINFNVKSLKDGIRRIRNGY